MGFEAYKPTRGHASGIKPGEMSIVGRGFGRFHLDDLSAINVQVLGSVILLIDRDAKTLALRACRPGECAQVVSDDRDGRPRIWLGGAIRAMGLDPMNFRGRHECKIVDDRLEIY